MAEYRIYHVWKNCNGDKMDDMKLIDISRTIKRSKPISDSKLATKKINKRQQKRQPPLIIISDMKRKRQREEMARVSQMTKKGTKNKRHCVSN